MAAGHGGARPGSGPKPKATRKAAASTTKGAAPMYADVLAYLRAVALGTEPGDALRVAAAKAVLPYEAPRQRAPVESPPPKKLAEAADRAVAREAASDFEARAAAVRARHGRK